MCLPNFNQNPFNARTLQIIILKKSTKFSKVVHHEEPIFSSEDVQQKLSTHQFLSQKIKKIKEKGKKNIKKDKI